jgi:hypothetical protein
MSQVNLFVKRDQFRLFEKAKIEIETSKEWTLLSSGLTTILERDKEAINFFKKMQEERKEDHSDAIQHYEENIKMLLEMIEVLNVDNEQTWK